MDQARWNRIEELLQKVLDLAPDARAAFLEQTCAGDEALRGEVEALLSREAEAEDFIESPAIADLVEEMAEDSPAALVGQQIGRYRIEAHIGSGGMGEVYKAWDENTRRTVALKTLPVEFAGDPERVRRFEQEAVAASRLNDPNIITIFEVVHADGALFIATEYVEGQTLRELLTDPMTKQLRRLDSKEAIQVAIQVTGALKAAHTAWIIHRDIKPENIMVRKDGLAKVLDFGIAKLNKEEFRLTPSGGTPADQAIPPKAGTGKSASNGTVPGMSLGTASYMSPEQARGEQLDGRTDLFSLGVVLFEMVTGQRLFGGATRVEALQAIEGPGEPLSPSARFDGVPRELVRIIRRALRRNREERYASAGELLDDLNKVKHQLENKMSRRIVGISALTVILALTMVGVAAVLSVGDVWEENILRDAHTAAARKAAFSPDGQRLVTVGEDKQVIVWDFARRERLKTFTDHTETVTSVAYSPDGKWFATGSYDQTVIVWDAERLQKATVLRGHRNAVHSVAFSPDGRWLASSALYPPLDDSTILWRVGSWEKGVGIPHGTSEVNTLLFSADSKRLMFLGGSSPNTWDVFTGQPVEDKFDTPLEGNNAALSPDATRLVSVTSRGEVIFADVPRRQTLSRYRAHQDHGRAVAYSPDGRLVVTGAENLILWDAVTRQKIAPLEYPSIVWSAVFSPNGRWFVSTHGDGAILVWDAAERELVASFNEHSGGVRAVAFSGDGKRIVSASEDQSIIIWDAEKGQKETVLTGHRTRVMGVAISADGRQVASADQDGVLKLWDVAQRQARWSIKSTNKISGLPNYCAAISPDGQWVATTTGVYESDAGRQIIDFYAPENSKYAGVYGLAFSADGRLLACVTIYGWLLLWDTSTWQLFAQQRLTNVGLVSVSFAPDGQSLVTGEDQGDVRLWRTQPLSQVAVLGHHPARIKSVAFSPDGKEVASAGDDKMIALWDVNRRKLIAHIGTHTSPVYAVAFSPDGQKLVSGEHDHSVRLYTRHQTLGGLRRD